MLTHFWRWEEIIKSLLPSVLSSGGIRVVFQPIFDIRGRVPLPVASEALARFPSAPLIPTGLWFKVARSVGLGPDLELLAARLALEKAGRLDHDPTVFINISPDVVALVLDDVPRDPEVQIVFDMPVGTICDERWSWIVKTLRTNGIGLAVDGMPPPASLGMVRMSRPDFVRVDTSEGDIQLMEGLASAVEWCSSTGAQVIAHRVERIADLALLRNGGADWAQGYGLG